MTKLTFADLEYLESEYVRMDTEAEALLGSDDNFEQLQRIYAKLDLYKELLTQVRDELKKLARGKK